MPIYTKRGDKGKTGLLENGGEKRVSKDYLRIEVIGALDELNSYLGIVTSLLQSKKHKEFVENVQKDLFTINSILAGAKLVFTKTKTTKLEKKIDELEKNLPKLTNFILSGGSEVSARFQFARSLARRAERKLVALSKKEKIAPQILQYTNRLSDTFFVYARTINIEAGEEETVWKI